MAPRTLLVMVDVAHRPGIRMHTLGAHAAQIARHARCTVLVRKETAPPGQQPGSG